MLIILSDQTQHIGPLQESFVIHCNTFPLSSSAETCWCVQPKTNILDLYCCVRSDNYHLTEKYPAGRCQPRLS